MERKHPSPSSPCAPGTRLVDVPQSLGPPHRVPPGARGGEAEGQRERVESSVGRCEEGEPWSHTAPGGLSPRAGAGSEERREEAGKGARPDQTLGPTAVRVRSL